MKISILTLFPEMFSGPFDHSILKRAKEKKQVEIEFINLRDFGIGKHKIVDDKPFGGGVGMVLRVDVVNKALSKVKVQSAKCRERIILLDARGETFNQEKARELSKLDHLILICGHYEGIDERVREHLVNISLSIGDYVLTGGEIPAMVVVDSVIRLLPGVLKKEATELESFSELPTPNSQLRTNLEHPQYTRPQVYKNWKVPKILLSGDHKKIKDWKTSSSKPKITPRV